MGSIEKRLERRLRDKLKSKGCICVKMTGYSGINDRMVIKPWGEVDWIEIKDTGVKPDKIQLWWHKKLRAMGHKVYLIDTDKKLNKYLDEI